MSRIRLGSRVTKVSFKKINQLLSESVGGKKTHDSSLWLGKELNSVRFTCSVAWILLLAVVVF